VQVWVADAMIETCKFTVKSGLDHRGGYVRHAEKGQRPQAPFPSGTPEHGL